MAMTNQKKMQIKKAEDMRMQRLETYTLKVHLQEKLELEEQRPYLS